MYYEKKTFEHVEICSFIKLNLTFEHGQKHFNYLQIDRELKSIVFLLACVTDCILQIQFTI